MAKTGDKGAFGHGASKQPSAKRPKEFGPRTLGPVSDLERHLPPEWWKSLFNSLYLKTDGDVVENDINTVRDVDLILDVCCGQGRHSLELARRGFGEVTGIDRSRYLIRLARKRARARNLPVTFSEGDARRFRIPERSKHCVIVMGNSFGYFEREDDDYMVLEAIKKVLHSRGKLVLDIVDGGWMAKNFEPRSWEWIDQSQFVNRERSLSSDGKRIISREVITNSDIGVIADQFYAERLYTFDEMHEVLKSIGFTHIESHGTVSSDSTRNQDLGMMAHRMFITAVGPGKITPQIAPKKDAVTVAVLMGDPKMPDAVKMGGQFNLEDLETINILKTKLASLSQFECEYLDDHESIIKHLLNKRPKLVMNLCDEGFRNQATMELHVPALLELLDIPYTGAGPGCLSLCYNKANVRSIAKGLEVDVPMETFVDPDDRVANLPSYFPALIKPNCGDSSIGITQNAVVHNAVELISYIEHLREIMPGVPILIQEYLQGAEYSMGLIGNPDRFEVLPVLEVDYSRLPDNLPKILSYESKWDPKSPYWTSIHYKEAQLIAS